MVWSIVRLTMVWLFHYNHMTFILLVVVYSRSKLRSRQFYFWIPKPKIFLPWNFHVIWMRCLFDVFFLASFVCLYVQFWISRSQFLDSVIPNEESVINDHDPRGDEESVISALDPTTFNLFSWKFGLI